jgi:hypothetical protein
LSWAHASVQLFAGGRPPDPTRVPAAAHPDLMIDLSLCPKGAVFTFHRLFCP